MIQTDAQAFDYLLALRDDDKPQFVLTCNFQEWELTDLHRAIDDPQRKIVFGLQDLPKMLHHFEFLEEDWCKESGMDFGCVNQRASALMWRMHDTLKSQGYEGHALECF